MTIAEAIEKIDGLKPNVYPYHDKIEWLSTLDGIIKTEIIDRHEGFEEVVFDGYDETTDRNEELLVSAPYDEVYLRYLEMQIDYANNEFAKYNNSQIAYNGAYDSFSRYYTRTHMPIGKRIKFF